MHYPSRKFIIRERLRGNIVKLYHSPAIQKRVRCASQIHPIAETHIFFLLVPLKGKMNSLPWAIFLILTGREKMGKVSLCLPCFNSRQGLASQWFLEVKFKRGALLYLAGPIALKVCLRQKGCSLTESTCRSDVSRSWAQLRGRFFSPSTINCLQCSIGMNYQIFITLFILFLLLENGILIIIKACLNEHKE